jgi:predicted Zn-dependent protease
VQLGQSIEEVRISRDEAATLVVHRVHEMPGVASLQARRFRPGQKILDEHVTITSDPWDPELLAAPFAPDGQPNKRITWWENGVLRNLTYDRYWAQQKNVEPVGFPAGIKMQGGEGTIDDLVRSTERGILVTRFWYIRPPIRARSCTPAQRATARSRSRTAGSAIR